MPKLLQHHRTLCRMSMRNLTSSRSSTLRPSLPSASRIQASKTCADAVKTALKLQQAGCVLNKHLTVA